MRWLLLGTALGGLGALGWWLDGLLAMRAWVVMQPAAEPEITQGWRAIIAAWPIAAAGGLLGGLSALTTLSWLLIRAQDLDHQRQLASLKTQCQHAQQQAAHAEQHANSALQHERDQLQQLRTQAMEAIKQAQLLRQQANADQVEASERIAHGLAERDQANRRAHHASAAFARKSHRNKKTALT
ncbi:hypothetical protein [Aeromonas cavernicola]|uniref:Uncharacterized protein n=1 Tax=Aeromonas cavernicola TaxID=1006623 RepID=A0A2H9U5B1_9GAMM|nr:hypothetical protein [Aeromonas cavernicola]PJG59207.1 hypothetical protein CUC53_08525 [Aeromonas cavernicola]